MATTDVGRTSKVVLVVGVAMIDPSGCNPGGGRRRPGTAGNVPCKHGDTSNGANSLSGNGAGLATQETDTDTAAEAEAAAAAIDSAAQAAQAAAQAARDAAQRAREAERHAAASQDEVARLFAQAALEAAASAEAQAEAAVLAAGGHPRRGTGPPRVLLAQRPPGKANAGLWEFPGGKVDGGETPEAALARELEEELGVQVQEADLVPLSFVSWPYPSFHLLMPLYGVESWRGEPHGAEGQAVVWVTEEELASYPLTPADVPLLPAVTRAMREAAAAR